MRLIDADALIEDCRKYINTLNPDNDWDWKEIAKMRWLIGVTMNLPTIEPQTGKWVESDTDGFVCSVCRNGYRCQPTLMGKPMFEYCPVCGAKMDGSE